MAQDDPDAYIEADLDFHLALAEAAANPLMLSLIDSIVGVLREQRMRIFQVEGGPKRGQYHHKRILEAVERRIRRHGRRCARTCASSGGLARPVRNSGFRNRFHRRELKRWRISALSVSA